VIIGHLDPKTKKEQSLMEHLFNVGSIGAENSKTINQENTSYLLGIYHDLGKADKNFQVKLKKHPKKKVNHSSAGARYLLHYISGNKAILNNIPKKMYSLFYEYLEIILYIITAHHGIYDIWSLKSEENYLENRINYVENNKYFFAEDILPFAELVEEELTDRKKFGLSELILRSFDEFIELDQKLNPKKPKEKAFYSSLKVRLLLSILKNADIEDTINAYEPIIEPFNEQIIKSKKQKYLNEIEDLYQRFSEPTNEMNKIRTRLGEGGFERGELDSPGIYQLNLPTGAGKTLISLRYGMQQLNKQNKDRFIYITPFLSVLEQNAKEIKDILKDTDIIEHHSNVVMEKSEESDSKKEAFSDYLIDTWDSPIVLSTMVQFFQTLFKGKSSSIRRFSSLANSVIILDEVQSLPVTVTHLFNMTMNFISQTMNSTIIMCTATQPTYNSEYIKHKMEYGGQSNEETNIVQLTQKERVIFERTEVHKLLDGAIVNAEDICEEVLKYSDDSTLIILNTKDAVKNVYETLKKHSDRKIYYLSTNLCPKHRQEIIEEMKGALDGGESIICVSTQLIEAGVDIDFDRLIRSYAGIDSIIQAMGRCNRHGNKKGKGIVKLAKVSKELENISNIEEIKEKVNVTDQILAHLNSPIDILQLNNEFYGLYYANNEEKMDYPSSSKDAPSGFDLLSLNSSIATPDLKDKAKFQMLNQSFQTAAREIDLITNETIGAIVYYKESKELIEELILLMNECENNFDYDLLPEINAYLQKLQPYTVNLYPGKNQGLISYLDGKVNILIEDSYDSEMGVKEEIDTLFF
jgi:CRISPR-associated endonuclease/helicase Cas3